MKKYARRLGWSLALLVGALVLWYLWNLLIEVSNAMIERLGPWSLVIVGVMTLLLAVVWVRYGAAGALKRWGVTIKPAVPEDAAQDGGDGSGNADVQGTAREWTKRAQ